MKSITGLICLGISFLIAFGFSLEKCVAFFYANKPIPDDLLYAYDWVIVSPENTFLKITREKFYMKRRGKLIAYLSIGEQRKENLTPELRAAILGENPNWNTQIMDVRNEVYKKYLIKKANELLSEFDGVFLDTLDSYKIVLKREKWKDYEENLKNFINEITSKYPDKIILVNRGFEIINEIKEIDGIVVESLFKERNKTVRNNIINFLKNLKEKGKEIILIEYEKDKAKLKNLIRTAKNLGFSIYIPPDKDFQSFGYSNCEIIPRKVILLYDSSLYPEPQLADVHRFIQLPLEYLGFIPILADINQNLPEVSREAGYAGVISMDISNKSQKLDKWLVEVKKKGLKLFFIKELPFKIIDEEVLKTFGISIKTLDETLFSKEFRINSNLKFYEAPYTPNPIYEVVSSIGIPIIEVKVGENVHTPFVITEWGGFALSNSLINDEELWVFDPFKVFKLVFEPNFPILDITTENGNRILTAHIDGDSFFDFSEVKPNKRNAEIIRDEILKRYDIPHTVSIIEAEIAPWGLYPKDSSLLESVAESIFKLSNVEPASHSFSHPFTWNLEAAKYRKLKYGYNLPVKGYKLDFKREILGSIDYINKRLLKKTGKKVSVFLWSGACNPTEEIVRFTYKAKVFNVNGGDTTITYEEPFLKYISPSGINLGNYFQVYTPIQNENLYTNTWTGPFWGFIKVIQSFELTEKPYRLKPISIYYHFYSGQKFASLNALKKVYEYALSRETTPLYLSEYAHKVLDFRQTAIIKLKDGFLIKNDGAVRTLRIPKIWGYPDLEKSKGVIGFKEEGIFFYVHLDNSGKYILRFTSEEPKFWLERANGKVVKYMKSGREFLYEFKSHVPLKAVFKNNDCEIYFKGKVFTSREVVLRGGKREKVKILCPK